MKPIQVIWNETSQGGKSLSLSKSIIASRYPQAEIHFVRTPGDWAQLPALIENKIKTGHERWIAAGGDGTVHSVLNFLSVYPSDLWVLGLIGVGSSNDYHKPKSRETTLPNGVCVRDRFDQCKDTELMEVSWHDENGNSKKKVSFLNSSLGITAAGNVVFSSHLPNIEKWKRRSVDVAILISAVSAWKNFEPIEIELHFDEVNYGFHSLANFSIFKNRYFSGSFRYPEDPKVGSLGIAYVEHEGKWKNLRKMVRLAAGKFPSSAHSRLLAGKTVSANTRGGVPVPLEIDGELYSATQIQWRCREEKVRICT